MIWVAGPFSPLNSGLGLLAGRCADLIVMECLDPLGKQTSELTTAVPSWPPASYLDVDRTSTSAKLISAKSSASTNTSITRTGLLSSMKSSRHSGNSVHCPRSASSTKRLINSPIESQENHNSGTAFSHNQGHSRRFRDVGCESALSPKTDIVR